LVQNRVPRAWLDLGIPTVCADRIRSFEEILHARILFGPSANSIDRMLAQRVALELRFAEKLICRGLMENPDWIGRS
jgi:hypothetical protein